MCRERESRVRNLVVVGLIHAYCVLVVDGSNLSFGNINHRLEGNLAGSVDAHEIT